MIDMDCDFMLTHCEAKISRKRDKRLISRNLCRLDGLHRVVVNP
jgi:hypothetical protein